MATSITLNGAATVLNQYQALQKASINQAIRNKIELENLLMAIRAPEGVYTAPYASMGNFIQPYQTAFTPSGSAEFKEQTIIAKKIKVDLEITEAHLDAFFTKWNSSWDETGKRPDEWGFPKFLWDALIAPQIAHEIDHNSYNGVYAAPTPGTAGDSIDAVDGLKTVIEDAITATLITPLTVGALSANSMVAKVRTFCQALPATVRYRTGKILMSKTWAVHYAENYRDTYGFGAGVDGNQNLELRVDDFNKTIVGVTAMEGSDRFILVLDEKPNLVCVTRLGFDDFPMPHWTFAPRLIQGAATIYRAYGFEDPTDFYVSDNA